jgi:hypothetical protein
VLSHKLASFGSLIPPEVVAAVKESVTVISTLPEELQIPIIDAYISALRYTFLYMVPALGVALFCALFVRNWNVNERGKSIAEHNAASKEATA